MIACVQAKLRAEDYRTEQSFKQKIIGIMEQIRREHGPGRLLAAFPEHIGTFCCFCGAPPKVWSAESLAAAARLLLLKNLPGVGYHFLSYRVSVMRALLLAKSAETERIYLSAFVEAARRSGAWIAAGSAILRWGETKRVYNSAPMITPTGTVIHRQHKVNLVEMETAGGLDIEQAPLNYISAVQSPFGNLGVAVCLDAFDPEIRERLRSLGSRILIQPSANNLPWNEWQQRDWLGGSYAAVAENKEFELAVNPMLVGKMWDLVFEGQSSIITPGGYAARAGTYDEEEILVKKGLVE